MVFSPGDRLGPFEISAYIGAGGMGEVYRAIDTNLKRPVAIKVLPSSLAADPGRLARFQREAEVLASLDHPHIADIFGLEKCAGVSALVMELVDGPTLADRIARGPIPLDETLRIAVQIAEALEAAHELRIVHRDLKPANIKLSAAGAVKVLDFGLAKAMEPVVAATRDVSQTPTITSPAMTQAGVILGTAAYMSPEQARGEAVDERADVWAFGCVLYEMLTGRMVFGAPTVTETLAKILEGHADLEALPATTPAPIRRLVRRCLERSPRNRLQHIGDARAEIADVRSGDHESSRETQTAAPPRSRLLWKGSAAAALVILAIVGTWLAASRYVSGEVTAVPIRFDVARPELAPNFAGRSIALAPDGSRLAYDTLTSLRVRSIAGDDIATGSRGGAPFFSPDGLWLAFFTENGLHRMPAGGGAAQLITAERSGRERAYGGTWGLDGTIVFARGGGLFRVSAEKGEVQTVIDPDTAAGELFYGWPEFLPDGRSVLFTIMMRAGGAANARIAVVDLTTRQRKTLIEGGLAARYLRTGHLLYATGGRLQIVSFDERRLETRGVPSTLQGVSIATTVGGFNADFDVSDNGTFAYASVGTPVLRTLAWVDLAGREEPIPAPPRPYAYPRISPDGTRVALEIFSGGNRDIWVLKFAHGVPTQISRGPTEDLMSVWSPDSARVYYGSNRMGGLFRIFSVDADGAGTEQEVFAGSDSYMPLHMPAPDTLISFASGEADPDFVAALPLGGGGGAARTLLGGPGRQGPAEVSPDGRMIAYQMVEPTTAGDPGTPEVIVRSYPDVDRRRKTISSGGGMHPLWGPAGSNNLFYWTPKGELKVVSVTSTPEIDVGNVRDVPLGAGFFTPLPNTSWNYAVSPVDGRILLLKPVPGSGVPGPINVTVNWFEELKRLTTN